MAKDPSDQNDDGAMSNAPPILRPMSPEEARKEASQNTEAADNTEDEEGEKDDADLDVADNSPPPTLPSNKEVQEKVRVYTASYATVDRQLHKGNAHKLTACFNERSHFLSPEETLSARYEPVPRGPFSLGLGAPSYRLVLRDEAKGLMMVIDPKNSKNPLYLTQYTPPEPLSEEAQKNMPADMAAFNAATRDATRLDQAYKKVPEARMTFTNTIQAALETKKAAETDSEREDMVRGTLGFIDNASTIKSGLKSVLSSPAGGLMTEGFKGMTGVFSLIDALRHLADGRVAQSVVSLSGSMPIVGAFIQEGVAAGAEKLGFDVDPGPIQQTIEGLSGLIPQETPAVCGTPPQINMKTLQASLKEPTEAQTPAETVAPAAGLPRKQETPHF